MSPRAGEISRYLINGLVATAGHFATLYFGIEVLQLGSAGLSNALASVVGITLSFLGNRYLVFRQNGQTITAQAMRFVALYALIAVLHGAVLYLWSDRLGLPYQSGFVLAVALQIVLGYVVNKYLVFGASAKNV